MPPASVPYSRGGAFGRCGEPDRTSFQGETGWLFLVPHSIRLGVLCQYPASRIFPA